MISNARLLAWLVILLSVARAQPVLLDHPKLQAGFTSSNGGSIKLNTQAGTLITPYSRDTRLEDCSDKFQVCLTDHHGFAFAYFRKCNDASPREYGQLRFPPKVVSALHNDVWFIFDASPKYLFHYAYGRGIVGIYVPPTSAQDFRSVLRHRNFRLGDLDAMEYRRTSPSDAIAACSN